MYKHFKDHEVLEMDDLRGYAFIFKIQAKLGSIKATLLMKIKWIKIRFVLYE